jgi:hypothetical protein
MKSFRKDSGKKVEGQRDRKREEEKDRNQRGFRTEQKRTGHENNALILRKNKKEE